MDATITQEIELGSVVCSKLKSIYFSDKAWIDCYKDVARKFSQLKKVAQNFYSDKTSMEVIQVLIHYSDQDIQDALG